VETRKKLLPIAEQKGVKLTYLPFIIKALLAGLIHFPLTNSSLDENNNEIIVKKYYHIGIATATEKGLMVPVVKNVDKLEIFELALEIDRIAASARNGKIALEDLKNSTFSITNVGSIGGLFSSPIINYPEAGIMGIHKIHKRPVVKNDQIVICDMMYISFSFDHRVVDGALAAEFAQYIIERLESPSLIFLELM
jgi:pyruvate dehydrogenase E2 component (dihydrolipoamide acetyltransferase)